jgi:hypothetical protein
MRNKTIGIDTIEVFLIEISKFLNQLKFDISFFEKNLMNETSIPNITIEGKINVTVLIN